PVDDAACSEGGGFGRVGHSCDRRLQPGPGVFHRAASPRGPPRAIGGRVVRPSRLRRLRIQRALQVAVLATGTLLVGTALSLAWHKNVMLVVAGTPQSVRTTSSSVGDLLRSEGVPPS